MNIRSDAADLDTAILHAAAGLKALEGARRNLEETEAIYPTHIHLSAAELAHAIELSMRVALRNS
ncbi:MAG: hypothetical protein ACRDFX_08570 [Chloroflexota bacterium]